MKINLKLKLNLFSKIIRFKTINIFSLNTYSSKFINKKFSVNIDNIVDNTSKSTTQKINMFKDCSNEKNNSSKEEESKDFLGNMTSTNTNSITDELKRLLFYKDKTEVNLKMFILNLILNSIKKYKVSDIVQNLKNLIDKNHKYYEVNKFQIEEINLILSEYIKNNKLNNNLLVISSIHDYIIAHQIQMNTVSLNHFINTYLEIKGFNSAYNLLVEASLLNILVDYTSLVALYYNIFKITNFKVRTKCKYFIENYVLRNYGRANKKLFEQIYNKKLKEIKNKKQDKKENLSNSNSTNTNKSQGRKKSEENKTKVINNWQYSLKQINKSNKVENQQISDNYKIVKFKKNQNKIKNIEEGKVAEKENSGQRNILKFNNKQASIKAKQLRQVKFNEKKVDLKDKDNKHSSKNETVNENNLNNSKQSNISGNQQNVANLEVTPMNKPNESSVNKSKRFYRKRKVKKDINTKDNEKSNNNPSENGKKPDSK